MSKKKCECFYLGLYPDSSDMMFGLTHKSIHMPKGNYYRLDGHVKSPFRHLIYPVPDDKHGGLGIHATLDASGSVRFGPDVEWLDPDDVSTPSEIDFKPNESREEEFYRSIRSYWRDLPDGALSPDYAGVRPKLWHPKHSLPLQQDFVIAGPKQHGVKGLFHLMGIESPGLTSSLALAEVVAHQVAAAEDQL